MKYIFIVAALATSVVANAQAGGCLGNEPVANASMEFPSPARTCQGGALLFDGAASTPGSGSNIVEYKWDFGDGILDSLAGPLTSHNYASGGQYSVQLILTANNGCVSINELDLIVQVSLTPSFAGTTGDQTVCLGDSVELVAMAEAPVWTPEVNSELGDGALIPDLQGVPFIDSITISGFDPGSIIDIVEEAPELCVNIEHSYMGDLVIQVTCPNGQIAVMHQQGGGGTYLGIPVDDESDTPGTCWQYCWRADATAGTWEANSGTGTLAAGTYTSVEPFTNLIGCPQNGDWILTINDMFAIDNGFLCWWSLGLDTAAALPFTTMLGLSADSCGWTGTGFIEDPVEPWSGVAVPPNLGDNDYTFSITDNFGCTYDTTITITVLDMHIGAIVGPAVLPGPGEVTYSIDPPMPSAQYIVWDPLPPGWLWSGNDVVHTDGVAILNAPTQSGSVQICAQAVFEGCSGDPTCVTVSSFVGIEEGTDPGSDLHLAPNPAEGRVLLTRPSATSSIAVELIDPIGKVVFSASMPGTTLSLDVSHLAAGTYQVRWNEGDRVRHIPFLIAR